MPEPTEPPACRHADVHWHPWKVLPGAADGSSPDGVHAAQGGICRHCRVPVLRVTERLVPGPVQAVMGAPAIPRRRHGRAA